MADVVRIVVLVLLAFDVGQTVVVAVQHYIRWQRSPRGNGALPLHVWLIATAHTCLVVAVLPDILDRLQSDLPPRWSTWLAGAGAILTVVALHVLAALQRRRTGSEVATDDH